MTRIMLEPSLVTPLMLLCASWMILLYLLAGFSANNVGKGAICLVCHNSRRGLRNDANPPTSYRAPHEPTQADVLMGQNAFFVQVGQRSSHANLKNSCVACHMQATPPPAGFSYNQSGTNHTFDASITICSQCHAGIDGLALQGSTEMMLEDLNNAVGTAASNQTEWTRHYQS